MSDFNEYLQRTAQRQQAECDAAQRHRDNLMPDPDPPEPKDAECCVCGAYPIFDWESRLVVKCVCPKCKREGETKYGRSNAVEAWNAWIAKMSELRKEG